MSDIDERCEGCDDPINETRCATRGPFAAWHCADCESRCRSCYLEERPDLQWRV